MNFYFYQLNAEAIKKSTELLDGVRSWRSRDTGTGSHTQRDFQLLSFSYRYAYISTCGSVRSWMRVWGNELHLCGSVRRCAQMCAGVCRGAHTHTHTRECAWKSTWEWPKPEFLSQIINFLCEMLESSKPNSDLSHSWLFLLIPFLLTRQLIIISSVLLITIVIENHL